MTLSPKFQIGLLTLLLISLFVPHNEGARIKHRDKVWILFKDRIWKKDPRAMANLKGFTRSAISRRINRAEVPFDESDLPVERTYMEAVRKAGATVLVESRWLHGVSAHCGAACLENIVKLQFVQEVRPVATYRRANEPIRPVELGELQTAATKRGYGKSAKQLTQIGVPPLHKKGYAGQGEIIAIFDGGFRKDHIAFKNQVVLQERDFVFNDADVTNGGITDTHGTATWSLVGGEVPGIFYGVAYRAEFLLAVTEDIRSETQIEEDHWVAAFEWADQLGATVISSSLGYTDWYTPLDYNGETAITSRVVSNAAKKGIVVVNAAGNLGPGASTLITPADAKKMLAVGGVDGNGLIAGFSSRGPTTDGRIKPEVVARAVNTFIARSDSQNTFARADGTSFACPLVAGAAATLLSAHPSWEPLQIREALMQTASQATTPDNTYGSGIVNLFAASEFLPLKSVVIDNHKALKNTTNKTIPYRVKARIRAQRGINPKQSFLYWKKEGTTAFQQVLFTAIPDEPDFFEAFIPPQTQGSTVLYYMSARDVKRKRITLPLDSPRVTFSFRIL